MEIWNIDFCFLDVQKYNVLFVWKWILSFQFFFGNIIITHSTINFWQMSFLFFHTSLLTPIINSMIRGLIFSKYSVISFYFPIFGFILKFWFQPYKCWQKTFNAQALRQVFLVREAKSNEGARAALKVSDR